VTVSRNFAEVGSSLVEVVVVLLGSANDPVAATSMEILGVGGGDLGG